MSTLSARPTPSCALRIARSRPALLREVFSVEAVVVPDPRLGVPLCIAYGLAAPAPNPLKEP